MRVAHLTYDMRIGGTEKVIANIIESCANSTCTHQILCLEQPLGPFGTELKKHGIDIFEWNRKPSFDVSLILKLRKHIKQHDIDILHCHQYTPWSYGALACIGLATKVIFTEHGRFYPDSSSSKRRFINPLLNFFTSAVTAISSATKHALVDFEYLPQKDILVIYNGIKPLRYEPVDKDNMEQLREHHNIGQNTLTLGTVARLDPIKNHSLMIDATAQLIKKGFDLHLIIVGDGEMRHSLEQQIEELDISKYVTLTGYKTHPKNYLQLFDVFLLTSFSEGTSMTLLEALSLAIPTIVTDVGGNPEIIDNNKHGLVINNDDLNGLTKAIQTLSDANTRERMSSAAKEHFDSYFTDSVMVENYMKLYIALKP
ncbi:MAG: glycosyltransferase [Alteromonadaceae bacterium]|nr:glycosyltransferase [Alteromonadaceae bacterium]